MDNLTLRKANPNDSEFAYCVRKAAFKEYVEKAEGWDEDEQRRLHERRFAEQDFRIINFAGNNAGFLAIDLAPDCLKVNQLMLLPEYQGKDIGRKCMLLIMQKARELRLPVRLRVMKVNQRALKLYKRLGFMSIGETETHDLMEWNG